jgi:hypothetical protein
MVNHVKLLLYHVRWKMLSLVSQGGITHICAYGVTLDNGQKNSLDTLTRTRGPYRNARVRVTDTLLSYI